MLANNVHKRISTDRHLDEGELFKISKEIQDKELLKLVSLVDFTNEFEDWNFGSIIQHKTPCLISKLVQIAFLENKNIYDSIGIPFALGETKTQDPFLHNFLIEMIEQTTNSEAWWLAAFALDKVSDNNAVNLLKQSLKKEKLKALDDYLANLSNKKSLIGVLLLSDVDNIQNEIYPFVKKIFLQTNNKTLLINCSWLLGRFRLMSDEILEKLIELTKSSDYEIKYYAYFAIQQNPSVGLEDMLIESLKDKDASIRKMAIRSLGYLDMPNSNILSTLEKVLDKEDNERVISELCKVIYKFKNPYEKDLSKWKKMGTSSENGLICDKSDKWYADPSIYDIFSESEDPENIVFDMIRRKLKKHKIINPVDLACGTGRTTRQIVSKINYEGKLYAVDYSKEMCSYLSKQFVREKYYVNKVNIINSTIKNIANEIDQKSSLIVSSFGFPSKMSDKNLCYKELKSVHELLSEDGIFITIGWDETFNDELNWMWYKFIPDNIQASNFEEWRIKRELIFDSPRNCNLRWFKKNIRVPLRFNTLQESIYVMGHLFGIDAAKYISDNNKKDWEMSYGVTINTKKEIGKILNKYYEKRN